VNTTTWILAAGAALVTLGLAAVTLLWARVRRSGGRIIGNAKEEARRIAAEAEIEAKRALKDADVGARERLLAARTEFERETRAHRIELAGIERRLDQREELIEGRLQGLAERERNVEALEQDLKTRSAQLEERERELQQAVEEQRLRLEQIAGLTKDQAKAELMQAMEHDARMEAANLVKRIEDEAVEKSKDKARRIISMAIQRIASEHVVESTTCCLRCEHQRS